MPSTKSRPIHLSLAGWISGNGAVANMALDRASRIDGSDDYTLFGLVVDILQRAIHPDTWENLRHDLAEHEWMD